MIVKVFSEWDIGFGNNDCFEGSIKKVTKQVKSMYDDFADEIGHTFEEAIEFGLIQIKKK